jgi:CRP-like cAMP-binding protein
MDERIEWLGQVPLFDGLDAGGRAEVARNAEEVDVPAGTVMTHEGRYEGYFYVVVSGIVQIERGGVTVDTISGGGFFGEIGLLDAGPRTATVSAQTDCRLMRIANHHFEELLDRFPTIRDAIAAEAERRLARIDEDAAT